MNIATYNIDEVLKVLPKAKGSKVTIGTGGLNLTVEVILKSVKDNYHAFENFANAIKGNNLQQTAYNIWHFLKTEIIYKKDKPNYEEVKTGQRLLYDKTGDCEDFSIFVASVLKALGYEPFFYVVAFSGNSNYGHIYVGVKNIIIDGVMTVYGKHPENITKYKIIHLDGSEKDYIGSPKIKKNISGMIVQQLSGLSSDESDQFIDTLYNHFKNQEKLNGLNEVEQDNFNRVKFIKMLEGPHREFFTDMMPAMAGIGDDMIPYFHDEQTAKEADEFLNDYLKDYSLNGLGSLWSWLKKKKKKFTHWAHQKQKKFINWSHKVGQKLKKGIKKTWHKVKHIAKKVAKFVVKVSLAPARAPFLLLMRLNFLYWSSKLYVGYLNLSQAKKNHLNLKEWKKVVHAREKFERFWKKIGGNIKVLRTAIMKGGKKTAYKKYGLKGLGVVATAASATAASGILAVIARFFKNVVWGNLKKAGSWAVKKVKKLVTKKLHQTQQGGQQQQGGHKIIPGYNIKSDDTPTPPAPSGGSSMTPLLIGGGLLAAFMLMK